MYVDILLSALIKNTLKRGETYTGQWHPSIWLKEHRTITLGLPRRSGKTTALVNLYKGKPSLLFAPTFFMAQSIQKEHGVQAMTPELLAKGRVIQVRETVEFILLDEWLDIPSRKGEVFQFATDLLTRNLLSKDIVIISVGS